MNNRVLDSAKRKNGQPQWYSSWSTQGWMGDLEQAPDYFYTGHSHPWMGTENNSRHQFLEMVKKLLTGDKPAFILIEEVLGERSDKRDC